MQTEIHAYRSTNQKKPDEQTFKLAGRLTVKHANRHRDKWSDIKVDRKT